MSVNDIFKFIASNVVEKMTYYKLILDNKGLIEDVWGSLDNLGDY